MNSNFPTQNQPIINPEQSKPRGPNIVLIIKLVIIFVGLSLVYWYLNKKAAEEYHYVRYDVSNTDQSSTEDKQTKNVNQFILKHDNETISVIMPNSVKDLSKENPTLYQNAKLGYGENVLMLVDNNKTQKGGKSVFYTLDNSVGKGNTPQERQENLYTAYQKVIEIDKSKGSAHNIVEKVTANNYLAIKIVQAKKDYTDINIIEYYIFGPKDVFTFTQSYSDGLAVEEDLQKILSTVKITTN